MPGSCRFLLVLNPEAANDAAASVALTLAADAAPPRPAICAVSAAESLPAVVQAWLPEARGHAAPSNALDERG
jgi:hypothetical protein